MKKTYNSKKLLNKLIKLLLEADVDWTQFSSGGQEEDDPVMNALNNLSSNPEAQQAVQQAAAQKQQQHQDILTQNQQALLQKGIDIHKLHKLGQGAGGIAYAIDNQRVLKVTGDASEAGSSSFLKGKNVKGIINIYDVWQFPNSNMYGIIMEKIVPFKDWASDPLKQDMEEIVDTFNLKKLIQKHHGDWNQIWQEIDKSELHMPNANKQTMKKALLMLANAVDGLKAVGIHNFFDVHLENLGKRMNGEVVIFDIGFAHVKSGSIPVLGKQNPV